METLAFIVILLIAYDYFFKDKHNDNSEYDFDEMDLQINNLIQLTENYRVHFYNLEGKVGELEKELENLKTDTASAISKHLETSNHE